MCMRGSCVRTECNPDPLQKFDTQIKKVGIRLLNTMSKIARVMLSEFRLLELSCFSAWAFTPQKPTKSKLCKRERSILGSNFRPPFCTCFWVATQCLSKFWAFLCPKKAGRGKQGWVGGGPNNKKCFLPLGVLCETMESGSSSSSCLCLWLHFLCLFSFSLAWWRFSMAQGWA